MLTCTNLSRSYKKKLALDVASLEIRSGATTVLGPNGSGKSTLFRILASADHHFVGNVELDGRPLDFARCREYRRSLGWMPQHLELPKRIDAFSYVDYVAWLKEVPKSRRREAVYDSLGAVGLGDHAKRKIGELSGGMQRRLGIAQAIVNSPSLILLDEPTAGLDPAQRSRFCDVMKQVATSATLVTATHILEVASALGGNVVVLQEGTVQYSGPLAELAPANDPQLTATDSLRQGYLRATTHPGVAPNTPLASHGAL